jgi:ESCRT-II complex subunit VPS25
MLSSETVLKESSYREKIRLPRFFFPMNGPSNKFEYPEIFNFPPFFTRQPNEDSWRKQKEIWIELIKNYCEYNKISKIDSELDIFKNDKIKRRLNSETIKEIFDELQKRKEGKWENSKFLIQWKKIDELASILVEIIDKRLLKGQIVTLYELLQGEEYESEFFFQMDSKIFIKVVEFLEKQGKLTIYRNANLDETGIKFL